MKLTFLFLCAACVACTADATPARRDLGPFSLEMPAEMKQQAAQGEDTFVGRFVDSDCVLEFDYGEHSDPLVYEDDGFEKHSVEIGGQHAVIGTWKTRKKDRPAVAVHFPSSGSRRAKLTIYFWSDLDRSALGEAIFRSVIFKEKPNQRATDNDGAAPRRV